MSTHCLSYLKCLTHLLIGKDIFSYEMIKNMLSPISIFSDTLKAHLTKVASKETRLYGGVCASRPHAGRGGART